MDEKSVNPIFFWLSENIFTERAIAEQRNDLDSYALTLTANIGDASELKRKIAHLYSRLESEHFKIKYVIANSILLFLSKKYRVTIKSYDVQQIEANFSAIIENTSLPLKYKIIPYFFTRQVNPKLADQLKNSILSYREQFLQEDDLDDLIEVEFALGSDYFSKRKWDLFDVHTSIFDIGKLSKLALLYSNCGDTSKARMLVNVIEEQVWKQISTASLPTISLLVYEAEKLISTNLPSGELTEALELLKKQNKKWAKLITRIQTDGVTVDLKNFNRASGLAAEDAIWSISLIQATKREKTYQINEKEYKDFIIFTKSQEIDSLPISRMSLLSYISFISLLSISAYIYFIDYHQLSVIIGFFQNLMNWEVTWQSIKNTKTSYDTVGEIVTSPLVISFILLSTLWRSWLYISTKHKFSIKYALMSIMYFWKYK